MTSCARDFGGLTVLPTTQQNYCAVHSAWSEVSEISRLSPNMGQKGSTRGSPEFLFRFANSSRNENRSCRTETCTLATLQVIVPNRAVMRRTNVNDDVQTIPIAQVVRRLQNTESQAKRGNHEKASTENHSKINGLCVEHGRLSASVCIPCKHDLCASFSCSKLRFQLCSATSL